MYEIIIFTFKDMILSIDSYNMTYKCNNFVGFSRSEE